MNGRERILHDREAGRNICGHGHGFDAVTSTRAGEMLSFVVVPKLKRSKRPPISDPCPLLTLYE